MERDRPPDKWDKLQRTKFKQNMKSEFISWMRQKGLWEEMPKTCLTCELNNDDAFSSCGAAGDWTDNNTTYQPKDPSPLYNDKNECWKSENCQLENAGFPLNLRMLPFRYAFSKNDDCFEIRVYEKLGSILSTPWKLTRWSNWAEDLDCTDFLFLRLFLVSPMVYTRTPFVRRISFDEALRRKDWKLYIYEVDTAAVADAWWYRKHGKKTPDPEEINETCCQYCGVTIAEGTSFCSQTCYLQSRIAKSSRAFNPDCFFEEVNNALSVQP